jgi:hypothetical protein
LLDDPSGARQRGDLARRRAVASFGLDRVGSQLREFLFRPPVVT